MKIDFIFYFINNYKFISYGNHHPRYFEKNKLPSIRDISYQIYQDILKLEDCPKVVRYPYKDLPNNRENCDEDVLQQIEDHDKFQTFMFETFDEIADDYLKSLKYLKYDDLEYQTMLTNEGINILDYAQEFYECRNYFPSIEELIFIEIEKQFVKYIE